MAIIDELIVKLGLDAKGFKKGSKEATDALEKTKKTARDSAKDINRSGEQAAGYFKQMASSAKNFLAVAGGVGGFAAFVKTMTSGQAALGLFAKNTGLATETVMAMSGAVEQFGGNTQTMQATLAGLTKAQQDFMLTGESSLLPYLNALGVSFGRADKMMLDLSKRMEGMDRVKANAILQNMGVFGQGEINMILSGSKAMEAAIKKQKENSLVTKKAAEQAQKFNAQVIDLKQKGQALGRDFFAFILPYLEKFADKLKAGADYAKEHKEVLVTFFTAVGLAMGGAFLTSMIALAAPLGIVGLGLIAVAGGVALLKEDYDKWKNGDRSLIDWSAWDSQIKSAKQGISDLAKYIKEHGGLLNAIRDKTSSLIDIGNWTKEQEDAHRIFKALKQYNNDYGLTIERLKDDWNDYMIVLQRVKDFIADFNPFNTGGKGSVSDYLSDIKSYAKQKFGNIVGDVLSSTADSLESITARDSHTLGDHAKLNLSKREYDLAGMTRKKTPYDALFAKYESQYQIPPNMLKLLAAGESNFNPRAVNDNGTSQDYGIMQHNSKYLSERGLTKETAMMPEPAIAASAKLVSELIKRSHGDIQEAFRRYNGAGEAARNYGKERMNVMRELGYGRGGDTGKAFDEHGHFHNEIPLMEGKAYKGDRDISKVNQNLLMAANAAAKEYTDYDVKIQSGHRHGDKRFHGKGEALDVALFDKKTGKKLGNYNDSPQNFAAYEKYAHYVKQAWDKQNPGHEDELRWGGLFGGAPDTYGALDMMHFDKGGRKYGMLGGSFEKGLTPLQRKRYHLPKTYANGYSPLLSGREANAQLAMASTPNGNNINNATNNSKQTNIQIDKVEIQTAATDAKGIARDIKGGLNQSLAMNANYGMN